jgi:hypothetical protein
MVQLFSNYQTYFRIILLVKLGIACSFIKIFVADLVNHKSNLLFIHKSLQLLLSPLILHHYNSPCLKIFGDVVQQLKNLWQLLKSDGLSKLPDILGFFQFTDVTED